MSRAAVTGMLLLALVVGCDKRAPPEQVVLRRLRPPVRRVEPPPGEDPTPLVAALEPAAIDRERSPKSESGKGLILRNDRLRDGRGSVNLLKIDRSRRDFGFTTTLGHGRTLGLSPLSEQIEALPAELGVPLAAVNGD